MKLGFLPKALGQDGSCFRGIYLHNEWFLDIWVFQDGSCGERCLELSQHLVSTKMFLPFLDLGHHRAGYRAETQNEAPIQTGEAQQSLKFLNGPGYGPLSYSGDLDWVHGYSIRTNNVSQEGDGAFVKGAFLSFNEQLVLG